MGRLVLLSGPSCVGKGPLHSALERFYPDLAEKLEKLVLYNSRAPRPAEKDGRDYHFRTREEIASLAEVGDHIVLDVRGDLQALDTNYLSGILQTDQDAFYEGNPFVATELMASSGLSHVPRVAIFLAPLRREEIVFLRDTAAGVALPDFVADVMRRKLLRRTTKQKSILSALDLENIEQRCTSAYREMQLAHRFQFVIPNHDGEDSENWNAFYYPIGDARRAMVCFAAILNGQDSPYAESWEPGLLP